MRRLGRRSQCCAVQSALPMRDPVRIPLLILFLLATGIGPAAAQTDTATLNASINGLARLSLSTFSISFPDADPDMVPIVPASQGPLTITAKARASFNGALTLTVQASETATGSTRLRSRHLDGSRLGFNRGNLARRSQPSRAGRPGVYTGPRCLLQELWSPGGTHLPMTSRCLPHEGPLSSRRSVLMLTGCHANGAANRDLARSPRVITSVERPDAQAAWDAPRGTVTYRFENVASPGRSPSWCRRTNSGLPRSISPM